MPVAYVGAAAAVAGTIGSLVKGSQQSGAVSSGQQQANAVVQPYVDTGENALARYADLQGINGPDAATAARANFVASPGYDYAVSQGLRAVDAGAASKGILRSGATIKSEESLGSNLANQDFSNYMGRLNNLAVHGLTAAQEQAGTDTSAAASQANIAGNTVQGVTNSVTGGLGAASNGLAKYFTQPNAVSGTDTTISNPNVSGGSYVSNTNPDVNF